MSKEHTADFWEYLEQASPRGRTMLLPALLRAQDLFGYLFPEVTEKIGKALHVPLAEITGVIEFYSMLYPEPVGKNIIRVCTSPSCSAQGAHQLLEDTATQLSNAPAGEYYLESVQCLGLCDQAPSALVNQMRIGHADAEILLNPSGEFHTRIGGKDRVLTARCGEIEPTDVDAYQKHAGFNGLKNAFAQTPAQIREAIKQSGLLGRGGAAFVTEIKWEGAANAAGEPKYIVCNADESEPGTFKDRILLENDPLAIIEGMIIGGYAIGAHKGFIYIRGEYHQAQAIFQLAIDNAEADGFLGKDILNSGFDFEIELRSGAGAYICGEETALFESIEGKRGFPRLKPPFPTTHGLYQKPTVINNVETFANVALILRIGVEGYCAYGTPKSSGPWLFCVSGDVEKPGIYEITQPVTLQELVCEQAGGIKGEGELKAILLGGAAGKFISPADYDVRLTQEDARERGLTLGSGAVVVLDETRDIRETLADLGHFFEHESCGKCYPCQLGTQRQAEILDRLADNGGLPGDAERLGDVGWTMTDASLCGLGQTAASAVLSAMKLWPELFTQTEEA
ncbi:MAG: NAD(P)H-dependent oxidoreductase subunit E [Chloroflexota bacterium]